MRSSLQAAGLILGWALLTWAAATWWGMTAWMVGGGLFLLSLCGWLPLGILALHGLYALSLEASEEAAD